MEYEYEFTELDFPPCRLVEEKFTPSFDSPVERNYFKYSNGKLTEFELQRNGSINSRKFFLYQEEGDLIKLVREDSSVLEEFYYENGLLKEAVDFDNGVFYGKRIFYYSNNLLNRILFIDNQESLSVADCISDRYGNFKEFKAVWDKDRLPSKEYKSVERFDSLLNPYFGLTGLLGNSNPFGQNNQIEHRDYVDEVLREEPEKIVLEYYENGLLKKRIEEFGVFEYFYDCD